MSDDTAILPYPPLPPSAYLGSKYAALSVRISMTR